MPATEEEGEPACGCCCCVVMLGILLVVLACFVAVSIRIVRWGLN